MKLVQLSTYPLARFTNNRYYLRTNETKAPNATKSQINPLYLLAIASSCCTGENLLTHKSSNIPDLFKIYLRTLKCYLFHPFQRPRK